jgi:hypothetical protein
MERRRRRVDFPASLCLLFDWGCYGAAGWSSGGKGRGGGGRREKAAHGKTGLLVSRP